jgi:hypothetical protein
MDKKEKAQFIETFIKETKEYILKKVDKMPEHWDGRELREYICRQFINSFPLDKKRKQAFIEDYINNDL